MTLVGTQNLMHTNGHPRVGDSLFKPINGFLESRFLYVQNFSPTLNLIRTRAHLEVVKDLSGFVLAQRVSSFIAFNARFRRLETGVFKHKELPYKHHHHIHTDLIFLINNLF